MKDERNFKNKYEPTALVELWTSQHNTTAFFMDEQTPEPVDIEQTPESVDDALIH